MILENFPLDRNSLNIILPMIDDEEQRRLREMEEEEEADWDFLSENDSDEEFDDFDEDF